MAYCIVVTPVFADTTTYEYDALGRLKKVTRSDGPRITYTLDPAGNRTQVVTEKLDVIAPGIPSGLTVNAPAYNRVDLSWTAVSDNPGGTGVSGYRIYRNGASLTTTASTSHSDTTVFGGASYTYRVAAYDGATPPNESGQSAPASITTPPAPDLTPPTTPSGLSASAVSSSQINLSWGASTDTGGSGLSGYKIYRNGGYLTAVASNSHADATVASNTSYSYVVYAYDGAGHHSGASNTASATTPQATPSAPTGLGKSPSTGTGNTYSIFWTASSGPVSFYVLEEGAQSYTVTSTSKFFSNKPCGEYTYRCKACNGSGQCSGYSNSVFKRVCNF